VFHARHDKGVPAGTRGGERRRARGRTPWPWAPRGGGGDAAEDGHRQAVSDRGSKDNRRDAESHGQNRGRVTYVHYVPQLPDVHTRRAD
jgi:hypothetical protein